MTGLSGVLMAVTLILAPLQEGGGSTGEVHVAATTSTTTSSSTTVPSTSADPVLLPAAPAADEVPPGLSLTGSELAPPALVGIALTAGGVVIVLIGRHRRRSRRALHPNPAP